MKTLSNTAKTVAANLTNALMIAPKVNATAGNTQLVVDYSVFSYKNPTTLTTSNFVRGTDPENGLPVDAIINAVSFTEAKYAILIKTATTPTGGTKCATALKLTEEQFTAKLESNLMASAGII